MDSTRPLRPLDIRLAAQVALGATTLAVLVWFGMDPQNWFLALLFFLVIPWLWRLVGSPLWPLAIMEGSLLAFTFGVTTYCEIVSCRIHYSDPWHFLGDMMMVTLVFGGIGLLLASLPTFSRRMDRSDKTWKGRVLVTMVLGAATIALFFVVMTATPEVLLFAVEDLPFFYALIVWGIPLAAALATGVWLRSVLPAVIAAAVAFVLIFFVFGRCDALECRSPDAADHPLVVIVFLLAVGLAGIVGRTWRRLDRRGRPVPGEDDA
ncbi:MAG: hypothetical protein KY455_10260 [Euryarchaeota archaeon]|nr:hypothetical protein [Euryarchaeota archaeon]